MNAHPEIERFGGVARLYGSAAMHSLARARVAVVGIGGVGSWTAEALARSGVGSLALIDLDDICVSNVNRQVHALTATIGQPKVDAMTERIGAIAPSCTVRAVREFWTNQSAPALLDPDFDLVVDAIDGLSAKTTLIAGCRSAPIPLITSGGAGGRRDPSAIRRTDLAFATRDPLLRQVRRKLRREHEFPRAARIPFGIPCVFSEEPPVFPWKDGCCRPDPEPGSPAQLDCATGLGTACHVTGAFGFALAAAAIDHLLQAGPHTQNSSPSRYFPNHNFFR